MINQSYTATIEVANSPLDVFNHILEVPNWWTKDFEGTSTKPGDEFVIFHPGQHYSKQLLIEVIPGKKVVWLVTDSELNWLEKGQHEWTNTKMVFEISSRGDKTILYFTHEGLVPEKECFERCTQGWDMVIKDWLYRFIISGKAI